MSRYDDAHDDFTHRLALAVAAWPNDDPQRCPECGHFVKDVFDHVDRPCPEGDPPSAFFVFEAREPIA